MNSPNLLFAFQKGYWPGVELTKEKIKILYGDVLNA